MQTVRGYKSSSLLKMEAAGMDTPHSLRHAPALLLSVKQNSEKVRGCGDGIRTLVLRLPKHSLSLHTAVVKGILRPSGKKGKESGIRKRVMVVDLLPKGLKQQPALLL